jgi:hypothetical protein
MLDEMQLRRPDFLPGISVRLADGQAWTLPSPPNAGARTEPGSAVLGEDYEAIVRAIRESEDEPEMRRAELALVIALLARNYHLGPAEFWSLLGAPSGTPEAASLAQALHEVALAHLERLRPTPPPGHSRPSAIPRPRHRLAGLLRVR